VRARAASVNLILVSVLTYGLVVAYALVAGRVRAFALFFLVFPVAVYYCNRGLKHFARHFITRQETLLKTLQMQQQRHLEALKEATGYYRTKTLIDKFEEPAKGKASKSPSPKKPADMVAKQRPVPKTALPTAPLPPSPKPQTRTLPPASPAPAGPAYKSPSWMDRLLDAVIGDDSRNQKFALICQRCFNHNGLAPINARGVIRYRCPNCGLVNAQQLGGEPSPSKAPISEVADASPEPQPSLLN